jgi:Protein of unknown function (DUF2585)
VHAGIGYSDPMAGVHGLGATGEPGTIWPVCRRVGRAWPGILGVAVLVALLTLLLLAMHRVPWCMCGYVKLWHGIVQSSENSQHLTDWYTFAHVLDGFGFYLALWLVGWTWPPLLRLMLATMLAVAWEIFENADFVIDHFRLETVALGYRGDSVVNSVGDVIACTLGFALAALLPVRTSIALATAMGIVAGWVISDDPTFVPMLVAPFDIIDM